MGNRREEKGGISENNSKKIFITSIVSIVLFSISLALPAFAMTVQFDHTVPPDDWYYVDHGAVIIVDASVDYDQYRDPNTAPANTQQVLNVIISATGGDSINVQLTETSATSGFFTFTPYVMFTSGANNQNTPALHVDVNDIVTTAVQSPPAGIIPIEEAVNIISAGDGAWPPTGTFLGNKSVKLTGTDSDLDGIVDSWETTTGLQIPYNGITYTYPCNSSISYDCPVVGKKDVYIEIDYMRRHAPNPDALNDVILAFRAQDIRLHIQTDEEIPHHANSMTGPAAGGAGGTDFDKAKDTYFGTSSDRTNGNLLTAKRQVFHYALFGHNLSTGFSGTSEIPGNDNAITLGKWAGAVGSRDQQAGTFMHELGHNLRLYHGGSDNTNCKPNYLSVMSYSRQFSDYVANRPLTFSSGANTALDEDSYIETNGIGTANSGQVTAFGPTPILTATVGGGINWDRDANTEGTTQTAWKDLNNFGTSSGCDGAPAPPTPSYSDVNDWARLTYDIKVPTSFGDGAPIGEGCDDHGCPFIVEPADEVTEEGSVPEIDGTEYIESIVPQLKFVEYDEEINSVIPIINQEQNGDQTCKCDGVDEKIKNQTDTQYNSYIDADNDSSELPKQEMNITQSRQFRILHIQAIDSAIMKLADCNFKTSDSDNLECSGDAEVARNTLHEDLMTVSDHIKNGEDYAAINAIKKVQGEARNLIKNPFALGISAEIDGAASSINAASEAPKWDRPTLQELIDEIKAQSTAIKNTEDLLKLILGLLGVTVGGIPIWMTALAIVLAIVVAVFIVLTVMYRGRWKQEEDRTRKPGSEVAGSNAEQKK